MLVRDYMMHDVVTIEPEARLSDALNIMRAHNVHRLPVVEDNLLIGIVSEKDLLYALPSVDRPISWVEASAQAAALPVRRSCSTVWSRSVLTAPSSWLLRP
jgi:acetoin utilization protein AcuB